MLDESSVIIQQFMAVQKRLDAKHDKHERLVKMSRDVTIESKRTIFLLQRLTGYVFIFIIKCYAQTIKLWGYIPVAAMIQHLHVYTFPICL